MNLHTVDAGRAAASAVVTAVLLLAGSTGASARPDAGPARTVSVERSTTGCSLTRVGAQLVRCDDLTGNGVSAPAFVAVR